MPIFTANGVGLYYEVRGEGVPVLGIHASGTGELVLDAVAVAAVLSFSRSQNASSSAGDGGSPVTRMKSD